MKLNLFGTQPTERRDDGLLRQFITLKHKVEQLPPLSPAAKVEFDHGVDLEHLYYSSKIEGTNLTHEQIKRLSNEEVAH